MTEIEDLEYVKRMVFCEQQLGWKWTLWVEKEASHLKRVHGEQHGLEERD